MRTPVLFAFLAGTILLAATTACTKTEGTSSGAASSTASTSAPASASAPTAASAAPDASPTAADTTTGTTPTGGADAAPTTAAGSASAAAATKDAGTGATTSTNVVASAAVPECGTKPNPDCPLQAWMKSNANPPVMTSDTAALGTVLDKIVGFAPPGYTNWASIAKDGAKAAKAGDLAGAKASCRTCHDQYKQKYKTEMRARKI